jgi:hypothetical protein
VAGEVAYDRSSSLALAPAKAVRSPALATNSGATTSQGAALGSEPEGGERTLTSPARGRALLERSPDCFGVVFRQGRGDYLGIPLAFVAPGSACFVVLRL